MDLKQLLPYQRSLFILGDVGSERYSLFRSYHSNDANLERYWHPEDTIFKQCTWVLFSSEDSLCFEWTENGLTHAKKIASGGTYFVSVSPGQLPLNTKLVFPPYFTDEANFKAYYEIHPLLQLSSSFLWFEGFPYGKADTVQQLRYLQDLGIVKEKIAIAITQIERHFVLSDIGDVHLGIQNAKQYFNEKGYRILSEHAVIPLQRSIMLEALRYEANYAKRIFEEKQYFLEKLNANLLYIEDDIHYALENEGWVVKLENCFSFAYVKNSEKIADVWINQLKNLFDTTLIPVVEELITTTYELGKIQDVSWTSNELQQIIQVLWKELEKVLLSKKQQQLLIKYSTQLEYELATMKIKANWYEYINYTIQKVLPNKVNRYLEQICKKYVVSV